MTKVKYRTKKKLDKINLVKRGGRGPNLETGKSAIRNLKKTSVVTRPFKSKPVRKIVSMSTTGLIKHVKKLNRKWQAYNGKITDLTPKDLRELGCDFEKGSKVSAAAKSKRKLGQKLKKKTGSTVVDNEEYNLDREVEDKTINMGLGRALINIDDNEKQLNIFYDAVANGFSVREVEQIVREFKERSYKRMSKNRDISQNTLPFSSQQMIHNLSISINREVKIKRNKKGKRLFQFGLFGHNGAQFFSLSRDIHSKNNFTINGVLGLGFPILGIGYILHPKGKAKDGFNYAITIGVPEICITPTILYQKNISGHHYYIIGVVGYYMFVPSDLSTEIGVAPILSYCYRF